MGDEVPVIIPANDVPFGDLCNLLEKLFEVKHLSTEPYKLKSQQELIVKFVHVLMEKARAIEGKKDCTFYPIIRLMVPEWDRGRSAYNFKSARLADLLVKVISLNPRSKDAEKLFNFKTISNSESGDLASVAYFLVRNRMEDVDGLTIKDVNDALDKISDDKDNIEKCTEDVLTDVFKRTTALQKKWFLRILLKKFNIGLGPAKILASFHPDAEDMYRSCNDLEKVCQELSFGDIQSPRLGAQLFTPISPMLSERMECDDIFKMIIQEIRFIELKYDGERFQIHMKNGKFAYYSRRGFDYTKTFGSDYTNGNLTPLLKNAFIDVKSFILDGEMLGWHKERQCLSSKGESFDVKKLTEKSEYTPCFYAFDILYYNGESMVASKHNRGRTLRHRKTILHNLFEDIPMVFKKVHFDTATDSHDVFVALNKAIQYGEEGIIIKEPSSNYCPGSRNSGWYKIKPEYVEGAMEDLDLIIIGADHAAKNSHGFTLHRYMVALADVSEIDGTLHRWVTMAQLTAGLSYDERERLATMLQPHWNDTNTNPPPSNFVFGKRMPDMWIAPEKSVIIQIRASELTSCNSNYGSDYSLRFARILKIRDDKPYTDAMTTKELNMFIVRKYSVNKLTKENVNTEELPASPDVPTRKRKATQPVEVAGHFKVTKQECQPKSDRLLGKKICILATESLHMTAVLEEIIVSHGGIVVPDYDETTFCCIADRRNARVDVAVESGKVDIFLPSAFENLILVPALVYNPALMFAISEYTKHVHVNKLYDKYGDPYGELMNTCMLKALFQKMSKDVPVYLTTREKMNLDAELFEDGVSSYSYLRGICIHFTSDSHKLRIRAMFYGARLSTLSAYPTHVIVEDRAAKEVLLELHQVYLNDAMFVTKNWLLACFAQNTLVPEKDYIV